MWFFGWVEFSDFDMRASWSVLHTASGFSRVVSLACGSLVNSDWVQSEFVFSAARVLCLFCFF